MFILGSLDDTENAKCLLFYWPPYIIATAPSDNSYVNKSKSGIKGSPMSRHKWGKMVKNDQKLKFSGKWQKKGVVIAWSCSLSLDIIATAPSDNSFVNKSRGWIKGGPLSRNKWWKMAKNWIFRQMLGKWGGNSQE